MFNIVWSNGLGSDQCVLLLQDYLCQDMIKIAQPGHAGAVPTPPQAGYWPACTYTCLTGNFRPSAEKASLGDGKRLVKLGQLMNQ